jgi:general secretion pathway protein K
MMRKHPQRGSALLMAMVIVTMVTTLAASMVWMQWRSVQVESAERGLVQSQWVLRGFLDYGRIFLREDARNGGPDHLGEQWAVPLAEVSIAAFLAADKDNTEDAPDGFMAGQILDATARYNLYNLLRPDDPVAVDPDELAAFQRLCEYANVAPSVAQDLAKRFQRAMQAAKADAGDLTALGGEAGRRNAPLLPQTLDQLVWLGIDAGTIERLRPYVVMYPATDAVPINVNTASREVLAAVVPGLDLGRADRLIQARQSKPFKSIDDMKAVLGDINTGGARLSIKSHYFELQGRMRLSDRILSQRYIVRREDDGNVITLVENSVFGVEPSLPNP